MKKLLMAATALSLMAGGAMAADMPVKAHYKAPEVVMSWTGCYIGVGFGYRLYNREHTEYDTVSGAAVSITSTAGSRGWLGTGQFGCDYQAGNWVIGAFVDADFSSIKGNYATNSLGIIGQQKETSSWAAGGRLGYQVMPGLLTFVSGGYTQARWSGVNFTNLVNVAVTDTLPSRTWGGWFIGAGTEYALGFLPGLFWKNEGRFASFNTQSDAFLTPAVAVNRGDRSQLYSYTVRSELVFRFGGGSVVAKY
jgi:outer membrane immunogenic protein